MIDHISIAVGNFEASKSFYAQALAPLGYKIVMTPPHAPVAGFGVDKPDFWIHEGRATDKMHVAFSANSHAEVDAFYKAALAAGGKDNGPPGLRAHYHPHYYGAFVHD